MTMAANCFNNKPTMSCFLLSLVCLNIVQVFGQSNYASHGNNINYIGNGLPEETVLDGKVSDIEPLSHLFSLRNVRQCGRLQLLLRTVFQLFEILAQILYAK